MRRSVSSGLQALARLSQAAIDLILPARCSSCAALVESNEAFCAACMESLVKVEQACGRCGLPESGPRCSWCVNEDLPYVSARSLLLYGGAVATAIHKLKFEDAAHIARPLGRLLTSAVACLREAVDLVVPVPLHTERLRARGYNQAALLAWHAARRIVRVDCAALFRRRRTAAQWRLTRVQRLANLCGAFRANEQRVRGRRILLVDDVMTTGATAAAGADALRAAGATQIHVLTLARAVP